MNIIQKISNIVAQKLNYIANGYWLAIKEDGAWYKTYKQEQGSIINNELIKAEFKKIINLPS